MRGVGVLPAPCLSACRAAPDSPVPTSEASGDVETWDRV